MILWDVATGQVTRKLRGHAGVGPSLFSSVFHFGHRGISFDVIMAAALLFVPVYLFYVIFLLSVSFSNFPLQKVNCVQFNEEATVILSGES